jgi:hypothetical protein
MKAPMGQRIIDVLEQAGKHHLSATDPRAYAILLLQIGGTDALRAYHSSEAYWRHVQAVLDTFFTSAQRAEICARLIAEPDLRARPEFQHFLSHALAERRLQELVGSATVVSLAVARPPVAPARRTD